MDIIQESEKTAGRRKVAKALQNSIVSMDRNWRTIEEVPCLMQYKGEAFYLRKRINGNVYTRSLKTDVFSVARERIPNKVREIIGIFERLVPGSRSKVRAVIEGKF
jgi:hypothetical protein